MNYGTKYMINRLQVRTHRNIESQIIKGGGKGVLKPNLRFWLLLGGGVSIKSQWYSESPIMKPSLIMFDNNNIFLMFVENDHMKSNFCCELNWKIKNDIIMR